MNEIDTAAAEINRLHELAQMQVTQVIENASRIGRMLIEVKDKQPKGAFHAWVRSNLTVSVRQAQRYMECAQGKPVRRRHLSVRRDTLVSHSPKENDRSEGIWENEVWLPESGFSYKFDEDGTYWVTSAKNGGFHVCKLYSGERLSSAGRNWRYTILADVTDADIEFDYFIGTRFAPMSAKGIHGILHSYGLRDLRSALVQGSKQKEPLERPLGEPPAENWYWDTESPDDGFYAALKSQGQINERGVALITSR